MRIQVELSEERVRELEQLMELTSIDTKKELLNNALTLFEWAVHEVQSGRIIASLSETDRNYKEIILPAIERVKPAKHSVHLNGT